MSAIGGFVSFDGRPCDPVTIAAIAGAMRHRAPDGTSTWIDGPAGLVHGSFITTPESAVERQPFADAAARLAITFDGRLDNRAELLQQLRETHAGPIGDAELALRLYRRYGVECVTHLLGDFAFAIWDADAQRVFCARDVLGLKPFCYRAASASFAWASEPGVLARHAGDMPAPNEGMVAEHLAIVTSTHDTVFEGIHRLPPAHLLTADRGGIRLRRYWAPDLRAEVRYRNDDEYVEHLQELIHRAVEARLRVVGAIGVSLSGGVDSSSLTGVAATLIHERRVPATRIEAFSLLIPGECDESPFWSQVVDRWNIFSAAIPVTPLPPGTIAEEASFFLDAPNSPLAAMTDRLRHAMHARGIRVALNGAGADDWLGTSPDAYADLVRHGQLGAFVHRLHQDAQAEDFVGWAMAAKHTCWPLLPAPVQAAVRLVLRRGRLPPWIDPAFGARIDLRGRLGRHTIDLPHDSWERYDTWHEAISGSSVYQHELIERSSARAGVEMWLPFMDRRIVDFGLALPAEQRWRDGCAKDLLRRAMAPYLPPDVAQRTTSPGAPGLLLEGLEAQGGRTLFEAMRAQRAGWVLGDILAARYDRAMTLYRSGDLRFGYMAVTLSRVAAVEHWARAMAAET